MGPSSYSSLKPKYSVTQQTSLSHKERPHSFLPVSVYWPIGYDQLSPDVQIFQFLFCLRDQRRNRHLCDTMSLECLATRASLPSYTQITLVHHSISLFGIPSQLPKATDLAQLGYSSQRRLLLRRRNMNTFFDLRDLHYLQWLIHDLLLTTHDVRKAYLREVSL